MDITNEKNLCVIAGTWGINEYVARGPVKDGSVLMNSIFCLPGSGYYLVEESSLTSAGNHEWFTRMFLQELRGEAKAAGLSVYQYADRLAARVAPGGQEIVFLPYLFGSNFNPRAKAALVGMDSSHTKAQIIRAVLEGIVFCHMDHIGRLLANRPRSDAIRLAGGAAKSPSWVQMFAGITGLPVEVIDTAELGALGCAMAAAVLAGDYPDLRAAAARMVRVKTRAEASAENTEIYRKKRARLPTGGAGARAGLGVPVWAAIRWGSTRNRCPGACPSLKSWRPRGWRVTTAWKSASTSRTRSSPGWTGGMRSGCGSRRAPPACVARSRRCA